MKFLLERFRLCWWKRAYNKIWKDQLYQNSPTCSTKTEEEASELTSFIYSNLEPNKYKIILDIGCGNGNLGDRVFKDCDLLVQADYNLDALMAIERNDRFKKYIIQASSGNLPFKENTFDCVFLYSLIHYAGSLDNAKQWIADMFRLLKRGGMLYIGDVPIKKWLNKELIRRFKITKTFELLKYYFCEFTQKSFSVDDFLDIDGAAYIKIISHPKRLRFSSWRLDIEIQKKIK